MTPNLAVIRVQSDHWSCPPLPIPLFLLWIPAILLAPFVLLAMWILCLSRGIPFWPAISAIWKLICSLPGTQVRVTADGNRVLVKIL